MTLPASFPLSMSQIATELGLSLPLSINHAWVIALAGKSGLPVSFSDLLGKTGRFDGNLTMTANISDTFTSDPSAPFFGGTFHGMDQANNGNLVASFSGSPGWSGNISVKNNTTGASGVLSKVDANTWQLLGANPNIVRNRGGQTDSFTILPSN
ncbi:hypothetical protein [Burkholderia ubonensis]|uniref:hypothetical protein n=1 Tax=Burkholderia ubonensis TaxID=101571 RepID=UPI000A68FBA1|nr:hypothetical protein [Burkholderia ubonensis]